MNDYTFIKMRNDKMLKSNLVDSSNANVQALLITRLVDTSYFSRLEARELVKGMDINVTQYMWDTYYERVYVFVDSVGSRIIKDVQQLNNVHANRDHHYFGVDVAILNAKNYSFTLQAEEE